MTDRIIILRNEHQAQITNWVNSLDKGKVDDSTLKLRIARLTTLYRTFEEFNDELAVLDPNDTHQVEFLDIQDRFYCLAGKIKDRLNRTDITEIDHGALNNNIRIENTDHLSKGGASNYLKPHC